jgi:DNA polymerase-1
VDNVPGVEKVGPKTAAKWIGEHGSLDGVIAAAASIKGVAGENLRKALDWLPTSRQLLTIKTDCDLNGWVPGMPALDAIRMGQPQTAPLMAFCDTYGFKGLARTLAGDATAAARRSP